MPYKCSALTTHTGQLNLSGQQECVLGLKEFIKEHITIVQIDGRQFHGMNSQLRGVLKQECIAAYNIHQGIALRVQQ